MKYISGIHALNISCELLTCGDWHQSGIQWSNLRLLESDGSLYGDYGIEKDKTIPEHEELFNVANHIRALLDLLIQGNFSTAQGFNDDYICNEMYDEEVFDKVSVLRVNDNWEEIDRFMGREYYSKWLDYKESEEI